MAMTLNTILTIMLGINLIMFIVGLYREHMRSVDHLKYLKEQEKYFTAKEKHNETALLYAYYVAKSTEVNNKPLRYSQFADALTDFIEKSACEFT